MTRKYYNLTISAWLTIMTIVLALMLMAAAAHAAALRVCYKNLSADVADVVLYVNNTRASSVFPGQNQTDGSICGTVDPLPPPVLRGTTQQYTVRGVNVAGEEGDASNAITFRYPALPSAPTLLSVGVVVP